MDDISELEHISQEDEIEEKINDEVRDKGEWETESLDSAPARNRMKDSVVFRRLGRCCPEKMKMRVNLFEKLTNGLTPYEMMYGKQDNDFAYNFD